ncbi:NAD(P)-binding protein [Testicularia cyperi]|uniref:NAD(P)-binding protein n=1 Tax=Testicularia cyperi TaxID=1882483 RepID=A0A317XYT3_9BASI|nr:NAD(P)-binding protein [Testicularia cyperi]
MSKSNTSSKTSGESPKRRTDLLEPEYSPHDPVVRLGEDLLHGPRLEDHIVVVLGVGPGLGLAIAQVFAAQGYTTAILSRSKDRLDTWAEGLHTTALEYRKSRGLVPADHNPGGSGGERLSAAFACDVMDNDAIVRAVQQIRAHWPNKLIGTACYNASVRKRGPFLEQRRDQLRDGVQGSIFAGFTFAQEIIRAIDAHGNGGSLLVTGATSSTRGREGFAGFAASKSGLRAMCQSIAREFGPRNVHVGHIIVDGLIESDTALEYLGLPKGSRFPNGAVSSPNTTPTSPFRSHTHTGIVIVTTPF